MITLNDNIFKGTTKNAFNHLFIMRTSLCIPKKTNKSCFPEHDAACEANLKIKVSRVSYSGMKKCLYNSFTLPVGQKKSWISPASYQVTP